MEVENLESHKRNSDQMVDSQYDMPNWMIPETPGAGEEETGPGKTPKTAETQDASEARRLATILSDGSLGAGEKSGLLKNLVVLLTKMCLNNTQNLRELTGAVYRTILLPTESEISQAALTAGKSYHDQVMAKGKQHDLGPPYLHIWTSIILKVMGSKHTAEDQKKYFRSYWNETILGQERDVIAGLVRCCRLKKTYNESIKRLYFRVEDKDLERHLMKAILMQPGAVNKDGSPPAGEMEREAQRLLAIVSGKKEKGKGKGKGKSKGNE